jgi:peptide-N4-(N-acetyl-beta-glucosaminyl)asparagine amidase
MLLQTRRGRCGEWANAFCACARACGLAVRWVLDLTDHVWAEYFSHAQNRWVHLDPCEDAYNQPLLYEVRALALEEAG